MSPSPPPRRTPSAALEGRRSFGEVLPQLEVLPPSPVRSWGPLVCPVPLAPSSYPPDRPSLRPSLRQGGHPSPAPRTPPRVPRCRSVPRSLSRRDARAAPRRARRRWERLRGAPQQGLAGIPVLMAGSPLAAWLSRRLREELGSPPSSPRCSDKAEPGGRWGAPAGWVRGAVAPRWGLGEGGLVFPLPRGSQPCLAPSARPLHGHPGEHRRTGLGRAEDEVSGRKLARRGAAWSMDVCPSQEGRVRAARAQVAPLSPGFAGHAGRPLPALGVEAPGGGSCTDGICLEHG